MDVPQILFLKGVFLENTLTLGDIFSEKKPVIEKKIYYDRIPSTYSNISDWPNTVNLLCCQCTLPIKRTPVPLPKNIEPCKLGGVIFDIEKKVCCSFCCAARVITETISNTRDRRNRIAMLKMIRKDFYLSGYPSMNRQNSVQITVKIDIPLAPRGNNLTKFGGDIEVTDYEKKILELEKTSIQKKDESL